MIYLLINLCLYSMEIELRWMPGNEESTVFKFFFDCMDLR